MSGDKKVRQELIDFIKTNDKFYAQKNLENHSITALTIIKTEIEIRIANSKAGRKK